VNVLDQARNAHEVPAGAVDPGYNTPLDPLAPPATAAARRSAAEEARTILDGGIVASLASLTADGDPWASVITYGVLADGTPVFCLSRLALHGRNLESDTRASIAVAHPVAADEDPSDTGRVTLAGVVEKPSGDELVAARAAYEAAVPAASTFTSFGDFEFWVLRVQKVRWVGGFGRMASTDPEAYRAAAPDPVGRNAAFAVRHLNDDHSDALLAMARVLAGHTDATAAVCLRADRYGLDLGVDTPRGRTPARVGFAEAITAPDGLRGATVELARRSREG
jgi:putative heme iron utilization protein